MTTLVTGASGHLGATLVRMLLARGERVRALVHDGHTAGIDGLDEVEQVAGDVRDRGSLDRAMAGCDSLFHCAALISIVGDPKGDVHETNVVGAGHVAAAALDAGLERMVHFSSVHAFDLTWREAAISEDTPRSEGTHHAAYDRSKWLGECRVRAAIDDGLDAVIVNPTGVIGPYDYKVSRMGTVFRQVQSKRLPAMVPGGFDFVDVRDVCQAAIAAREHGRTGENYLLAGAWYDVPEICRTAADAAGVKPPRLTTPMWLARAGAPFMTAWARITRSEPIYTAESLAALRANPAISSARAEAELGFSARSLAESCRDFYAWLDHDEDVL